jgi:hypothetical protein
VAVARSVGDKSVLSNGLAGTAPFYWLEGNLTAAASVAEEALAAAHAIGSVIQVFLSLLMLIFTACLQGDLPTAREYCAQVLAYARETGASQWLFLGIVGFGTVACFGGQWERGVRLVAAGQTPLHQRGLDLSEMGPAFMVPGQTLERAQVQLGLTAFQAAWAEGQHLTMEQALALATEDESADAPYTPSL